MKQVDIKKLEELVQPVVESQGYELVDLVWKREFGNWIFQVTIDRKPGQGFISHDDCSRVSKEVSVLLDVHDILPGNYNLEVSSPGIDRPLKKGEDFIRFVGHKAKIRLKKEGQLSSAREKEVLLRRNFQGFLERVENEVIFLRVEGEEELVSIRFDEIEKANLVENIK